MRFPEPNCPRDSNSICSWNGRYVLRPERDMRMKLVVWAHARPDALNGML